MAKRASPARASLDREKWTKVFNAMTSMLRTKQTQLDSLAKDRKLLEDRIRLQHERWVSDVKLFQEQITQMEMDFTMRENQSMVEAAKWDMISGLKERDAYMLKDKFGKTADELEDFIECFHILSRECFEAEGISSICDNKVEEKKKKSFESELRMLKYENQQLSSQTNSEISALVAEKSFIWNQYNQLEKDMTEQLRQKSAELDTANEKIESLVGNIKELQTSNKMKDNEIDVLKNQIAKLEAVSEKQNDEISSLSRELQLVKKTKSDSATPILRSCTPKGSGNSKRKQREDTQKLFTSAFKIPKLKATTSSPQVG